MDFGHWILILAACVLPCRATSKPDGESIVQIEENVLFGAKVMTEYILVGPSMQHISFVVNGEDATRNSHPYQVTLQAYLGSRTRKQWVHICGGAIVSPTKVITAAHCLFYWNRGIRHRAGMGWHSLSSGGNDPGAQTVEVIDAEEHPDYQRVKGVPVNDIAVLTLREPVRESLAVNFVHLPRRRERFTGQSCTVAGWGQTEESEISKKLQTIQVPVIKPSICKDYWRVNNDVHITRNNLCTHASNHGRDALRSVCKGDSGGPLVCGNNTLAGLVSWGRRGCEGCYPDVLTKVSEYLGWLTYEI